MTDGLFLCRLIATAPFIDVNRHSNVMWLMNHTNLDYKVKDFMSRSMPLADLTDKHSTLPEKEEALRFFLTARALVIQQFRSSFDHAFEATWICSEMLLDHAPQLTGDREAAGEFANSLATNEARNNKLTYDGEETDENSPTKGLQNVKVTVSKFRRTVTRSTTGKVLHTNS